MRRIPPALNEQMNADPFYQQCCITGTRTERIERHHNLIFAGRQVNEIWAILPLAKSVHDRVPADKLLKERCDWVMLSRATDEQLRPYCKVTNYIARKNHLMGKYGPWSPIHTAPYPTPEMRV